MYRLERGEGRERERDRRAVGRERGSEGSEKKTLTAVFIFEGTYRPELGLGGLDY